MEMMLAVVILISLAIALLYIGQHFKLPSIVSFLIIGILVGPFGFALITNQSAIEMVGQIGIILLLFTICLLYTSDAADE